MLERSVHTTPLLTALTFLLISATPLLLQRPLEFASAASSEQNRQFNEDCSDPHYREIACTVTKVDCSSTTEELTPRGPHPDEAHDIRVESFSKESTHKNAGGYQLTTDISWQTPPNNSSKLLSGFLLEIEGEDNRVHSCFLLSLFGSNWTNEAINESPRLHFSTDSLFRFANDYEVNVYSLPESPNSGNSANKKFSTPHDPSSHHDRPDGEQSSKLSPDCTKRSNPFASKWTAGFKQIVLYSMAKMIQVHFVGAPPQYCFEQYEVRLLDESGMELLHSGFVSVEEMRKEVIGNSTVYYGQYNFTNLELDISYIPSVIPTERARDGRCLCPVYGTDPYDNKVVCSCVAADWKPVRLTRPDIIQREDPLANSTAAPLTVSEPTPAWLPYLLLNLGIIIVLITVGLILLLLHRQYRKSVKISNIRFVRSTTKGSNGDVGGCGAGYGHMLENGHLLTPTADQHQQPLSVLLVYSHDSTMHEEAVIALAEFLRDLFNMEVTLDAWDRQSIETNLVDYLSSSVINADKVLVINSMGASQRYLCKINPPAQSENGMEWVVERKKDAGSLDHLFLPQLDMALQHHSVISTRFSNTPGREILPALKGHLQYVLPDNIVPLLSRLVGTSVKADKRAQTLDTCPTAMAMRKKVEQMVEMERTTPNWFSASHHRRLVRCGIERKGRTPALIQQQPASDSKASRVVTIPMAVTVEEGESGVGTATTGDGRTSITPPANVEVLESTEVEDTVAEPEVEVASSEWEPQADSGIFHTGEENLTMTSSVPLQPSERDLLPSRVDEQGEEVVENGIGQPKLYTGAGTLVDSGQKIRDMKEYGDSGMVTDSDVHLIQAT